MPQANPPMAEIRDPGHPAIIHLCPQINQINYKGGDKENGTETCPTPSFRREGKEKDS